MNHRHFLVLELEKAGLTSKQIGECFKNATFAWIQSRSEFNLSVQSAEEGIHKAYSEARRNPKIREAMDRRRDAAMKRMMARNYPPKPITHDGEE